MLRIWFTTIILKVILQHDEMTVTSEERVLDAILTWSMEGCEIICWTSVDKFLSTSTPEEVFGERLTAIDTLLPFVRFPLLQLSILERVYCLFLVSYYIIEL